MRNYYTYNQIHNALERYRGLFLLYVQNNYPNRNTVNNIRIYRPHLNSNISECLVRRLNDAGMLHPYNFPNLTFAEGRGDLQYQRGTVEVKSTGSQAFSYFSGRDLNANYIIWIHFRNYLEGQNNQISVYVFPRLNDNIISQLPRSRKINLNPFLTLLNNNNHQFTSFEFDLTENGIQIPINNA